MNRNELGAKPECNLCHGQGKVNYVVKIAEGVNTEIRTCKCVNATKKKNKVYTKEEVE